jgi:hypothetical protein
VSTKSAGCASRDIDRVSYVIAECRKSDAPRAPTTSRSPEPRCLLSGHFCHAAHNAHHRVMDRCSQSVFDWLRQLIAHTDIKRIRSQYLRIGSPLLSIIAAYQRAVAQKF